MNNQVYAVFTDGAIVGSPFRSLLNSLRIITTTRWYYSRSKVALRLPVNNRSPPDFPILLQPLLPLLVPNDLMNSVFKAMKELLAIVADPSEEYLNSVLSNILEKGLQRYQRFDDSVSPHVPLYVWRGHKTRADLIYRRHSIANHKNCRLSMLQ